LVNRYKLLAFADDHSLATPEHMVWDGLYPELQPSDFERPHKMKVSFLARLGRARARAGVPFRVVSDSRDPGEAGVKGSAHEDVPCGCVDLRVVSSYERFMVVLALALVDVTEEVWQTVVTGLGGFTRVGIYPPTEWQLEQFGKGAGSVHVDDSENRPDPRIWTGF
jgi:hypothetical protein